MIIDTATYLAHRRRIVRSLHQRYPQRRDVLELAARAFATHEDPLAKRCTVTPLLSSDNTACALGVCHPEETRLQLAFFEATQDAAIASTQELLEDAKRLAAESQSDHIIAGINGNVVRGIGYLLDHHDAFAPLDVVHTPEWYSTLWESLAPTSSHQLLNFQWDTNELRSFFRNTRTHRANDTLRIRTSRLRHWKQEITTLTNLMNASAAQMPHYTPTTPSENYFAMKDLPWILRPEHLLFAVDRSGNDVGYVFWYDDVLELLPPGHESPVELVVRTAAARLRKQSPSRFVLNAMAVHPSRKGLGTIFALLSHAAALTRAPLGESTFASSDNPLALAVARKTGGRDYKHYKIYEFPVS